MSINEINYGEFERIPSMKKIDDYILEKNVGHLIPVSKCETLSEIKNLFEIFEGENFFYRGQKDPSWDLTPSLKRNYTNCLPANGIEEKILASFRNSCVKNSLLLDGNSVDWSTMDEYNLWAVGQHYGLKTPLIDWTKKTEVGLFFTFEEFMWKNKDGYRAFYVIKNPEEIKKKYPEIKFIHSTIEENGRLKNQNGLFSITEEYRLIEEIITDDEFNSFNYFRKIYLRENCRKEILNHLKNQYGIDHQYLFPGLEGIIRESNLLLPHAVGTKNPQPLVEIEQNVICSKHRHNFLKRWFLKIRNLLWCANSKSTQ